MATTTLGGKAGRTASPLLLFEAGEALLEEALAPLADNLSGGVQPGGDLVIPEAFRGVEHDPSPDDIPIRRRISTGDRFQCGSLCPAETDPIWATSRHHPPSGGRG
jgi:hypothetical protein